MSYNVAAEYWSVQILYKRCRWCITYIWLHVIEPATVLHCTYMSLEFHFLIKTCILCILVYALLGWSKALSKNWFVNSSSIHCFFSTTDEAQVDHPTLVECVRFQGRERRINISQEIGTKYLTFGTRLLEELERINSIALKHMRDDHLSSSLFVPGMGYSLPSTPALLSPYASHNHHTSQNSFHTWSLTVYTTNYVMKLIIRI